MEDRHVAILDLNKHWDFQLRKKKNFSLFWCVRRSSGYEAAGMLNIFMNCGKEENFESDTLKAFVQCFLRADKNYFNKRNLDIENGVKPCYAGTTALSVLFRGHRCFVATLGDSLAVRGWVRGGMLAITHFHEKNHTLEHRYSVEMEEPSRSRRNVPQEQIGARTNRKREVGSRRRRSFCVSTSSCLYGH